MVPSYCIELTPDEQTQLLTMARKSIQHGLATHRPLEIEPSRLAGTLAQRHGNFVTLTQDGMLHGCIGSLKTTLNLAQSVAVNAFNAAFNDSRFAPLSAAETGRTRIEISVLSRPEPVNVSTHEELLATLRPGKDDLLMLDNSHQTTFLPKVWEQLRDPQQFVAQLMIKAGRPGNYWSDTLNFHRYRTISFTEHIADPAVLN